MKYLNDPIGRAILDYGKTQKEADITVHSDLCEDDIIPVEVLFRSYKNMPEIEKKALSLCRGKVLDIGAGTGIHANYLKNNLGLEVFCIEASKGAVEYLSSINLNAIHSKFEDYITSETYDTLLLLMNGIGIAKRLENLEHFLNKAKALLNSNGQILFDSSDVLFLYENEDGSIDLNLNSGYYGDFKFQMEYKKHRSDWFEWLYVDYDNLHRIAKNNGFSCRRIIESENHYLAQLVKL